MPLARVQSLVGTNVVCASGRDSGEVENLLLDRNGQVRAAVVEWGGGFLGIGQSLAFVPIDQLHLGAPGERVRIDLIREQLEALPRYDRKRLADYGRKQGWGDTPECAADRIRLHCAMQCSLTAASSGRPAAFRSETWSYWQEPIEPSAQTRVPSVQRAPASIALVKSALASRAPVRSASLRSAPNSLA